MKLIGAGLPRTATMTQKIALETLGFGPCYHMSTVLSEHSLVPGWVAALAGNPDWETIFGGFKSTVDYPGSFYYRELAEAYPDAKVLLSVRDGHSWARSMHDTIWGVTHGDTVARYLGEAHAKIDPLRRQFSEMMNEMFEKAGLFGPNPKVFDGDLLAREMERHNAEVREAIPADRLLEWSPRHGWEPLCGFLGVPVPDTPLPRVNDAAMFNEIAIDRALAALGEWRSAQRAGAVPGADEVRKAGES